MNTQRWVGLHASRISHITESGVVKRPRDLVLEKFLDLSFKFFNPLSVNKTLPIRNAYIYLNKGSLP